MNSDRYDDNFAYYRGRSPERQLHPLAVGGLAIASGKRESFPAHAVGAAIKSGTDRRACPPSHSAAFPSSVRASHGLDR